MSGYCEGTIRGRSEVANQRKNTIEKCILRITSRSPREQWTIASVVINCCRWSVSHSDLHHWSWYCINIHHLVNTPWHIVVPGGGVLRSLLIFLILDLFMQRILSENNFHISQNAIIQNLINKLNTLLAQGGGEGCRVSIMYSIHHFYSIHFVNSVSVVSNWPCVIETSISWCID